MPANAVRLFQDADRRPDRAAAPDRPAATRPVSRPGARRCSAGAPINETEGRAVLHTALRNLDGGAVTGRRPGCDAGGAARRWTGWPISPTCARRQLYGAGRGDHRCRQHRHRRLRPRARRWRRSRWRPITTGRAAISFATSIRRDIAQTLRELDPATTLVIVASKTFTTIETMTNARTAKAWMARRCVGDAWRAVRRPVDAPPTRPPTSASIPCRVFGFADWVGGRYSMWGPIGLSLMIAIGPDAFRAFLRGGQAMDRHFRSAPWRENMPALLALVGLWHNQVCGHRHPRRAALRQQPRAAARLPSAARDGEQRQGRRDGRHGAGLQFRPRGLGRAGHERAACLLPADPPGHAGRALRVPRRRARATRTICTTSISCWSPTASPSPRR